MPDLTTEVLTEHINRTTSWTAIPVGTMIELQVRSSSLKLTDPSAPIITFLHGNEFIIATGLIIDINNPDSLQQITETLVSMYADYVPDRLK